MAKQLKQDGRNIILQMARLAHSGPEDNDFLIYIYNKGSKAQRETIDDLCEGLTGRTFGQIYAAAEPANEAVSSSV